MVAQFTPQQQVESLRVRFYRAYIDGAANRRQGLVPIGTWLQRAEALEFDGQPSRYQETGTGKRVYTVIDRAIPSPTQFRLNRTTYQGVPPAELRGNIGTNYLSQGQGLMEDTWHMTAFEHGSQATLTTVIAIATKGNIAPNTTLRDYLNDKFPAETAQLKIEQLAHRDILNRLATMGDGTLFEITIRPAFVETMRAVDDSMAEALQASQNVYEQRELSQTIRPVVTGRFGLRERFEPLIRSILGNPEYQTNVTKLRIGGIFGNSDKATVINLLSNDLTVEIDVPRTDQTFAILDANAVYTAIQEAYTSMGDAITEATEVSAWGTQSDGTSSTSSGSTPRQPPLWPSS